MFGLATPRCYDAHIQAFDIDAESKASHIACVRVAAESKWMWIKNCINRIDCRVNRESARIPLVAQN